MHHTDIPFPWSKEQLLDALLFAPPKAPLTPQDLSYLEGYGTNRSLERARWELLTWSRNMASG